MQRLLLLPALALAAFGAMGTAAEAAVPVRHSAVVLSVLGERHQLRLVEGPRVVDVAFRAPLTTGVGAGARITFVMPALRASQIVLAGHTDHVSVPGFVVRDGKSLGLRLADGSLLPLTRTAKLQVGQLLHVVVRFGANGAAATPAAPSTPATGTKPATPTTPGTTPTTPGTAQCAKSDCTFDTIGSVSAIDTMGDLTIIPVSGAASIIVDPGQVGTDDVYIGDFVHVVGTQNASSGAYTLTSLDELVGCDNVVCTLTLDADVEEIDTGSVIVEDQNGDEYQVAATAAQLASIQVDHLVHITGTQDPTTGNYTATTIKDNGPAPD